jgi:membrane protein DedA with SNARE-associated domain
MFDWMVGLVEKGGYVGIALLMLAENLFPPIPSELIMPLAGFSAAQGKLNVLLVILSGTIGSVFSALAWYYLGKCLGPMRLRWLAARHGRWVTLSPADVEKASQVFARWGVPAVFFGRLVPAVRTLISVPAGITAMRMNRFLAWTTLGTALWTAFLTGMGYALKERYLAVAEWANPVSNVIVGVLIVVYLYRVINFQSGKSESR